TFVVSESEVFINGLKQPFRRLKQFDRKNRTMPNVCGIYILRSIEVFLLCIILITFVSRYFVPVGRKLLQVTIVAILTLLIIYINQLNIMFKVKSISILVISTILFVSCNDVTTGDKKKTQIVVNPKPINATVGETFTYEGDVTHGPAADIFYSFKAEHS